MNPAASWVAVCHVALVVFTIPYGKPPSTLYTGVAVGLALTALCLAVIDPMRRWRHITIWPILAVLGAWSLSSASSAFPAVSFERSFGMGIYSLVFVTAQIVWWLPAARISLKFIILIVVLACVLDLVWQRLTLRSLFTDSRVVGLPGHLLVPVFRGSQGNPNDLVSVCILLPLCLDLVRGKACLVVYTFSAALTALVWAISHSRQALLAWLISFAIPIASRLPRRSFVLVMVAIMAVVVAVVLLVPGLRARAALTVADPLTGRGLVFLFGLDLFAANPVSGVGPSLFGHHYVVAVREGWTFGGQALVPVGMPWVHSIPIEALCETGIVGAMSVGASIAVGARRLLRAWRSSTDERNWYVGLGTSVMCFMVVGMVDMTLIKDWVRICFWLLLGLCFSIPDVERRAGISGKQRRGLVRGGAFDE